MSGNREKMNRLSPRRLLRAAMPLGSSLAIRRPSPLLLLAAALVALVVLFAPGAQPAQAQRHQIPGVTLSVSPNPVNEGTSVTVTVRISRSRNQNTVIPLVIPQKGATDPGTGHPLGVTAEAGDHGSLSSITIPSGATSATGTITTAHDTDEDDEVFMVFIGDPPALSGTPPTRAWEHGSPSFVTVRIVDDEGFRRVSLSAFPNPVSEGNSVDVYATLLTADGREAPLSRDVTIPLTITDGTAEASDHGSLSSITISAGERNKKGTITTAQDADADDETFTVALDRASSSWPSDVSTGPTTSVEIRIRDDETATPGSLSVEADPACESTVSVTSVTPSYRLRLTPAPSAEAPADYRVVGKYSRLTDWLSTVPIPTSGRSSPISINTFAGLVEAYPEFTGFEFRLNNHPNVTARCTWTIQTGGM